MSDTEKELRRQVRCILQDGVASWQTSSDGGTWREVKRAAAIIGFGGRQFMSWPHEFDEDVVTVIDRGVSEAARWRLMSMDRLGDYTQAPTNYEGFHGEASNGSGAVQEFVRLRNFVYEHYLPTVACIADNPSAVTDEIIKLMRVHDSLLTKARWDLPLSGGGPEPADSANTL